MLIWVGIAIVVGQGVLVGAILYGVRSFGAYTRAVETNTQLVLQTHQQNLMIAEETFNIAHDLTHHRAERRRRIPPDHAEEVVA